MNSIAGGARGVERSANALLQWLAQFSNALLDDVQMYRQDASGQW
ncbi:hypothetical protein [Variovorax sp. PAMC26660]|nr:hypothetical protein [Variovorax sp. PAMC26660]